jgi:acyl carrier protein
MSASPETQPQPYVEEMKQLILAELDLPNRKAEDLDASAPLFGEKGLGLDSIDALQIAMGIEERFGVRIPEGEASHAVFQSIETLARFVSSAKTA